jgi:hypothetical protein
MIQSTSQQKKKQCSSPLSTCGDKTSVCSTPSLSPIKNEPIIIVEKVNRQETLTPLLLPLPSMGQHSPSLRSSSTTTSSSHKSLPQKQKNQNSSNDTSLLSFERHELSAGNTTLSSTNEFRNPSPAQIVVVPPPPPTTTNADWSYYVSVGETKSKVLEQPTSSSSSSTSSSSNSNNDDDAPARNHVGGLEFFIDGEHQQENNSTRKHDYIFVPSILFCSIISSYCSITISSISSSNSSC